MDFLVLFEDASDADPSIRKTYMQAHLAFLEDNAARISAAGPLSEGEAAPTAGAWVVTAADETEVEALIHTDPFWPTGLRKSYRILRWRKVFADGQRQI